MTADLLALLAVAHPNASPEQLRLMLDTIPDKASQKPAKRVVGARPRSSASVERRRSLASGGWMPGNLACRFTVGEAAALAIVAQEVARHGACRLFIEKIAALSGTTRSTVKRALKEAHGLGFIRIEERRLTGWRNDANVVLIVDPAWSAWLRLRRRGEGSRKGSARNTDSNNKANPRSTSSVARGFRSEEAAKAPGSSQNQSPAQAIPWSNTASSRGGQGQPRLAGVHAAEEPMPGLQRWGVHRHARLRGA